MFLLYQNNLDSDPLILLGEGAALEDFFFFRKKNPGPNFARKKYLGQGKFYCTIVLYTYKKKTESRVPEKISSMNRGARGQECSSPKISSSPRPHS